MKKIFWSISGALILVTLIFNVAYYGFEVMAENAYSIVATVAMVVSIFTVFVIVATLFIDIVFSVAVLATVVFAVATVFSNSDDGILFVMATVFTILVLIVAALALGAERGDGAYFRRALGAYMAWAVGVAIILLIAPISLLWSIVVATSGVGATAAICFLQCPKFFRRKQEEEPCPAA